MEYFKVIFIPLVVLTFYFNFCKYDVMADTVLHTRPYKIFFWSDDAQISNSPIIWLFIHLTSALLHVLITGVYTTTQKGRNVFIISHHIFTSIVILNIWHFLQYNFIAAIAINMIPLLVMSLAIRYDYMMIYCLSLLSPVIIEIAKYLRS